MPEQFKLMMVKLSDLDTDSYQRNLHPSRAQELADNWDMAKITPLHISARDNSKDGGSKWYVVDGQHEAAAAQILGLKELPAIVWYGHDHKREAEIFHDKQYNRYGISDQDSFRARIEAGDPVAIDIVKILTQRDMALFQFGHESDTTVRSTAAGAMEEVYSWGHLEITLDVVKAAYPAEPRALQAQPLKAIGSIYKNWGGLVDTDRLVKVLQDMPILVLKQAAENLAGGLGGSIWPHMAIRIMHDYNTGLRDNRRLENYRKPPSTMRKKFSMSKRLQGKAEAAQ